MNKTVVVDKHESVYDTDYVENLKAENKRLRKTLDAAVDWLFEDANERWTREDIMQNIEERVNASSRPK